jgi:hypothetical protein
LAQAHLTTVGSGNLEVLTGAFTNAAPTTDAVEFRLYGWNAATPLDSTHLVGASMRARFASVAGSPIDPTGELVVQGDLFHLEGGEIAIDLGGHTAGEDYDTLDVLGKIELQGDLVVTLADAGGGPFAPSFGDSFSILTASQGVTGQFGAVVLPALAGGLVWDLDYLPNEVTLSVSSSGDFNEDGAVNAADYVTWRKRSGAQAEYETWRANYGTTPVGGASGRVEASLQGAVPEPSGGSMLLVGAAAAGLVWRGELNRKRCAVPFKRGR